MGDSIGQRMLGSLRCVIPALAAGLAGWVADQVGDRHAAGLRAAGRHAGSGVQALRLVGGCCGQLTRKKSPGSSMAATQANDVPGQAEQLRTIGWQSAQLTDVFRTRMDTIRISRTERLRWATRGQSRYAFRRLCSWGRYRGWLNRATR